MPDSNSSIENSGQLEETQEETQVQEPATSQEKEETETTTTETTETIEDPSVSLQLLNEINLNIQATNFYFFVLLVTIFVLLIWKLVWKTFMVLIEKF